MKKLVDDALQWMKQNKVNHVDEAINDDLIIPLSILDNNYD